MCGGQIRLFILGDSVARMLGIHLVNQGVEQKWKVRHADAKRMCAEQKVRWGLPSGVGGNRTLRWRGERKATGYTVPCCVLPPAVCAAVDLWRHRWRSLRAQGYKPWQGSGGGRTEGHECSFANKGPWRLVARLSDGAMGTRQSERGQCRPVRTASRRQQRDRQSATSC